MSPEEPHVNGNFGGIGCSADMKNSPLTVVRFPSERVPRAAVTGATRFQIWRSRVLEWIGRVLNSAGAPGAIRNMSLKDTLTGQEVSVAVSAFYVRLTVNDRDYFFNRLTGRFDGSGSTP